MQTPVIHIQLDDNGIPRTINRGVKVKMIAQQKYQSMLAVEEIADHYQITIADVYGALTYYHDNQAYFDAQAQELEALIDEAKDYSASLKAKILQRMADKSTPDQDTSE